MSDENVGRMEKTKKTKKTKKKSVVRKLGLALFSRYKKLKFYFSNF